MCTFYFSSISVILSLVFSSNQSDALREKFFLINFPNYIDFSLRHLTQDMNNINDD